MPNQEQSQDMQSIIRSVAEEVAARLAQSFVTREELDAILVGETNKAGVYPHAGEAGADAEVYRPKRLSVDPTTMPVS
jgi:hypothetical protein